MQPPAAAGVVFVGIEKFSPIVAARVVVRLDVNAETQRRVSGVVAKVFVDVALSSTNVSLRLPITFTRSSISSPNKRQYWGVDVSYTPKIR